MTREETQRFFDRRRDAFNRRDAAALTLDHAEHCVLESPVAGEVTGRAAIENVYRAFFKSFPDLVMENAELLVDNDRAVQVATIAGTNVGGFMDLPPTGRQFRFPVVFIYRFENGQIVHEKRIYDFTGMLVKIGILKAKPA